VQVAIVIDTELGVDFAPEGKPDPIVQIVMLRFQPHVTEDSEIYSQFLEVVSAFKAQPNVNASLRPAGYMHHTKEQLLSAVQWPDKTQSITHVLTVTADSPAALRDLQAAPVYGKWLQTEMPHLMQDGHPAAMIFYTPMTLTASC